MAEQTTGGRSTGPVLQAPLSATIPAKEGQMPPKPPTAPEPPEVSGQPSELTPQTPDAPTPSVPGIEDTDWVALSPEDRARLAPILKKVERGVSAKFQDFAQVKQKAAAWDAALSIREVNDAIQNHLDGKSGNDTTGAPKPEEEFLNLEDGLDPAKLRDVVAKTVQAELSRAVTPIQQQLSGLYEVVARRELNSQLTDATATLPGIANHRDEIVKLLADGKAQTVEDAYDMIQGRLSRVKKPTLPQAQAPTPEQVVAQTAVSPEAGPYTGRVSVGKSSGMLEHLRAALREHHMTMK